MNYTKPEINILGEATRVIEFTGQKTIMQVGDAPFAFVLNPAYDLDE